MAYVSLLHHGSKPHRDRTLLYDKKKFLIFICTEHQKNAGPYVFQTITFIVLTYST